MSSHERLKYSKSAGSTSVTETTNMASVSRKSAFLACCVTLLVCSLEVHAGLCIACSYTYAGDGTRDYECVSNPDSFVQSITIPCNFDTHSCTIRTVYSHSGNNQIQSLSRSCLASTGRDFHCTTTTPTSCELECRTNLCNNRHGDILGTNTGNKTSLNYPLIGGAAAGGLVLILLSIVIVVSVKRCRGRPSNDHLRPSPQKSRETEDPYDTINNDFCNGEQDGYSNIYSEIASMHGETPESISRANRAALVNGGYLHPTHNLQPFSNHYASLVNGGYLHPTHNLQPFSNPYGLGDTFGHNTNEQQRTAIY